MEFGMYIKQIRESRDLSVRELARRSGVSVAHISQLESGNRGTPKPDTIKKLADGLNCDYDELMRKAGYGNAENDQSTNAPSPSEKKDKPIQGLAFIDGGVEELDEEEIEYLKESLELFRRMKERKAKEREGK